MLFGNPPFKIYIKEDFEMIFNPKWTRKFPDPSKNLVFKLQITISPKVLKSDKRFIARSKEDNQGFQFNF